MEIKLCCACRKPEENQGLITRHLFSVDIFLASLKILSEETKRLSFMKTKNKQMIYEVLKILDFVL